MSQPLMDQYQPSPTVSTMKTYNMYYTTSRLNVKIHLGASSSPCVYYGESSILTTKPHIQLRAGDSKSAPVVAVAKVHLTSRHVQLGVGDFAGKMSTKEDGVVWEEMRREKFRLQRSDYEFQTSVGLDSRRTFGWRVENALTKTVYSCVDDAGQVVANLRSGGMSNWKKGGEIDVAEGLETELEALLIVSALAIFSNEAGWSVCQGYSSG